MTQAIPVEGTPGFGPAHAKRPSMVGVGTIIWLASELMFFSGLFASYFTIRAHDGNPWPPTATHVDPIRAGIFTFILVMSSVTMQHAVWQEEKVLRSSARFWTIMSFLLGAAFVANQLFEWLTVDFTPKTNAYGSMFFMMTGLHALHVTLGLLAMIALLGRMIGPRGDPGEIPAFQAVAYYWHFVDIVWVGLYASLFLLH
ncbi:MAG TPA: cytochrome c oxidase subunit 3 [Acidimicrobiales bacterium]